MSSSNSIRQYGCCMDNFQASKALNIASLAIDTILFLITAIMLASYLISEPRPCYEFRAIGCVLIGIAILVLLMLMITDFLLLYGSTKRTKIALIIGLILKALTILGLFSLGIMYSVVLQSPGLAVLCLVIVGFKVWIFLVGTGTLQELIRLDKTDGMNIVKLSNLQY